MTLLPANFAAPKRGSDLASSEAQDGNARPDAGSRGAVGLKDIGRLSVSNDGRLYWDDKPVVVRRRLQLSRWQTLGAIVVGLAALIIAISGGVQATIAAHDWMCGAKWVTSYCPAPPAPPTPPAPPPRPELPN